MNNKNINSLSKFGFSFEKGGAHTARTIMLDELQMLLNYITDSSAKKNNYLLAVESDNCLSKRSGKTRILTYRHLADLYGLDPSITLYRSLLFFWRREPVSQPLLALLCAYARDPLLRVAAPFILGFKEGDTVTRESVEEYMDSTFPGRFSRATLKSTAQNLNSSFTKSGHLYGRSRKTRCSATPAPGSASYALLLSYLTGSRGESLLSSEYSKLLDCSQEMVIELAGSASQKGWIVMKRIGDVIEVLFPNLLTDQEMEWLREQN